jgi:hypothetical protein
MLRGLDRRDVTARSRPKNYYVIRSHCGLLLLRRCIFIHFRGLDARTIQKQAVPVSAADLSEIPPDGAIDYAVIRAHRYFHHRV